MEDNFSIADLRRQQLVTLDAKLADAERIVAAAQEALAKLRYKRDGVQEFIDSLETITNNAVTANATVSDQNASGEPISAVILAVFQQHPAGLKLEDVPDLVIEAGGPELVGSQVRSTVKYLGRREKLENVRRGFWRIKTDIPRIVNGPTEVRPPFTTTPSLLSTGAEAG